MAKPLSILYVTGEAFPYAKESEIADIAASLSLSVRGTGHDIRLIIPKYGCISERRNRIHGINRLKDIPIEIGGQTQLLTTKSSAIVSSKYKVQVYVVTNTQYFGNRKGIYHDPVKWTEYSDNFERFVFFARAVIETCVFLGWFPDIIHCNDWQTALLPTFIKHFYPHKFKKTKTILTIHDVANQGEFPISKFKLLGLPDKLKDDFTHKKNLNILKSGIIYANHITTVSDSFLQQILKDKELTNGLNTVIKQNINKIDSIRNGIDSLSWVPESDSKVVRMLENDFVKFKNSNKISLCNACGIEYKSDSPLIGVITQLSEQKGIDLIIESIRDLMKLNIRLVILGQGGAKIKEKLLKIQQRNSKKMSVNFAPYENLMHLVAAGADMFLIPSRQESNALNALYSLAYGAVPIAYLTGGLKDVAVPFNKKNANCFAIKELSLAGLLESVEKAMEIYKDKEAWEKIVKNCMDGDYSSTQTALRFSEIYKKIHKEE